MAKLWQRSSDPKTKIPLCEINLKHLRISRPSVIFLSGIFTTNNTPAYITEGIEEIENLIGGRPELKTQPDIYALSHKNLGTLFNIAAYNGTPDKAYSRSAKRMAEALIMPLVLSPKGKPLDIDEACKNLRHLTFVAYSAGTVFAQEMFNAAFKQMKDAGYKGKDARHILGEVVLISMATVSRPAEEKERFTTLYLAASNDIAVRLKNRIWRPLKELFSLDSRDLKIHQLSRTSLLITAYIHKKMWHWQEKPDGTKSKKDILPMVPSRFRITSNHEMPHYTTGDDEHNQFSKLVLNTIINAVNRNDKADVFRLLDPVTARNADEAKAYIDRLDKALIQDIPSPANQNPKPDLTAPKKRVGKKTPK